MANEIRVTYPSGDTLYACVFSMAGQVYYIVGDTFEDWGTAGRGADDYDIAITEVGTKSGAYRGTFPVIDAGLYVTQIYLQAGANPADQPTDKLVSASIMDWDGLAERTLSIQSRPQIIHEYYGT